jgi:ADP-ribosylglycohydrolase
MPSSQAVSPDQRHDRVRASARWAAYGDALGFITELADAGAVRRRAGRFPIEHTVAWKRRVGGRGGPTIELPAGCISDDTQLRLAVSRCIGPGGFDPDAFAKIELTVWPSYALGAGRGSKAAAAHLARREVSWSTNFYDNDRARYVDGGGNGAAMRVQPHVWASPDHRPLPDLLAEVYSDAVITHGHPRGLLGAGLHALCLRLALSRAAVPGPDDWRQVVADLAFSDEILAGHSELGSLWLGMWRQRTGRELRDVIAETGEELVGDLDVLEGVDGRSLEGAYRSAVEALGAFKPDQRGSATKTALLGAWLAWRAEGRTDEALVVAANQLGTDTDSIATMAGALLGAAGAGEPGAELADRGYIDHEADRMWAISYGGYPSPFPYPDLRHWQPPRTQSDVLAVDADGGVAVCGLGPAVADQHEVGATSGKNAASWQWVDLWFGQRVLVKRRTHLPVLQRSASVRPANPYLAHPTLLDAGSVRDGSDQDRAGNGEPVHTSAARRTLHELTDDAIAAGFDPQLIGRHLLELSEDDDGIERATQYAAVIAKARLSRRDRERRDQR